MQIPVILFDLCSGLGPEDPARTVHAPFTSATAARKLLLTAIAAKADGTLLLTPGADIFVVSRSAVLEAESLAAATAKGYTIDVDAMQAAWELGEVQKALAAEPVSEVPVEATPDVVPEAAPAMEP